MPRNQHQPGDWLLHLRPMPSSVPAVIRMRQALKVLGRAFRLRCVAVDQVPELGPPAAVAKSDGQR